MEPKPKPRWVRFAAWSSVVLLVAALAWVGYSLNWIRQRRQLLELNGGDLWLWPNESVCAPSGLWLFGERGYYGIACNVSSREEVQRMFPEAKWVAVPGESQK